MADNSYKPSKILIIVDYQYDFYSPNGSLYVPEGETLETKIIDIMSDFDDIIFTADAHPYNHSSFKINGGQWPVHCVEGTIGASIPLSMIEKACNSTKKVCSIFYKGQNTNYEEYGAFKYPCDLRDLIRKTEQTINFCFLKDSTQIAICGLASNFCVLETLRNFYKNGYKNLSVFLDGCKGIDLGDGRDRLQEYMIENNIPEYKQNEK